ncbi:MAG: hypothetical protein HY951_19270 [Bacteroidia bacterium]|nr:hypothetical protein [Bacteroidia bacterium]
MRKIPFKLWLIFVIISLLAGIASEYFISHTFSEKINVNSFSQTLQSQRSELKFKIEEFSKRIEKKGIERFLPEAFNEYSKTLSNSGLYLFAYKNQKLVFWSDNSFIIEDWQFLGDTLQPVAFVNNAWVVTEQKTINEIKIVGFVLIKNEYPVENKFLKDNFNSVLNVTGNFNVTIAPQKNGFQIKDNKGNFLFTLMPKEESHLTESHGWLPSLFYLLAFISLLFAISKFIRTTSLRNKNLTILIISLCLLFIRGLMMYFKFPHVLYEKEFFGPGAYASSIILPSLGDVLIDAILIFYIVLIFYREYTTLTFSRYISKPKIYLILWLGLSVISSYFIVLLARSLILDSNISFQIYNILDIDINSITAFAILTLLFSSQFFIFDKAIIILRRWFSIKEVISWFIIPELLVFAVTFFIQENKELYSLLFFISSFVLLAIFRYSIKNFGFYKYVILIFLTAIYFTAFTLYYSQVKSLNVRKVVAIGLSNERDLVAEMLLEDLQKKIVEDKTISELARKPLDKRFEIFQYLRENYFYGFWTKYDIQTTVCTSYDNLKIEQTGEFYGCFDFFEKIVKDQGVIIPGTNFYFVDNEKGRISYLGILTFLPKGFDSLSTRLFIELDSRLLSQELGYPELLLDKKVSDANIAKKYSYAKYRNGKLLTRNGEFEYRFSLNAYNVPKQEFFVKRSEGYEHLFYKYDKNTTIVLSTPAPTFYDVIIGLSYTIVLFFILFLSFVLIRNINKLSIKFTLNIRSRILISFISVLVLSFILIGSGTVYYIISRYEKKNYDNISEKIQSVLVELNNKIGKEEKLLPEQTEFITSLLIKFSNVFYSDINLYDNNGKLYATSRPEVFNKGFVGNLINPEAYYNILYQYKPEVILEEHIGELKYLSAYVPFYNVKGKVIAYLNLPYFTRQNTLTREVSSFAITLVNIYLILILLAMSITVFITNGLTRPLIMLQRKFREIELGKKNEPIVYERMDEIGSLVSEYNRMLEELSSSAEILAKSEREIAWREMAKQIAHEIKNPLTPMKLSVQHLLRSYNDKTPGWENLVDKMGKTLIEQIDALSTIASEFSLFARLPSPVIERINIVEKAQSIVQLYKQSDNVNIVFENHNIEEIYVNADKEQILRVLTNLVKNAIQAIPSGKEGLVKVETLNYSSLAIVKISDNGTGITDEVQKKLFNPNFTTKTSGMGLGLAMVKNMVEGMGGQIQYVTKAGEGTTFFVELPCV